MKTPDSTEIILFTNDMVLTQILNRMLERCSCDHFFTVYDSFSDAVNMQDSGFRRIILVDDSIIGTSSFELISFLRLNKKISAPIIFFGVNEHSNEKKAFSIGANYFIGKPFNPDETLSLLKSITK
jgi:two-component system, OmpR family, response regulator VicR